VRVIDRSGRIDRLIFQDEINDTPWLYDWSRDGSQILVKLSSGDGRRRIALIDVNTRAVRVVHAITQGDPDLMSLSADGRYVAYDVPDDSTSPPHQSIRIVDTTDDSEQILLPNEQVDNRFPLWRSDGRSIFFLSDRSGTPDGWVVPVIAGRAAGEPQIAARNLGAIGALGLADDGSFYYDFQAGQFDLYEATLDPQSMTLAGQPHAIRGLRQGSNIGPSYSPDGGRLAYLSQHTTFGGKMTKRSIVVRYLTTARERELPAPLEPGMVGPTWSPDGRRLLVAATNRANQWGLFVVDAGSGAVEHQIIWPNGKTGTGIRPRWRNDGKAVLFSDAKGIVEHSLAGGEERVVLANEDIPSGPGLNTFAYSRDGRLAFTAWNQQTAIDVVDPDGIIRELVGAQRPRVVTFQGWFPPGDYLLYSLSGAAPRQPDELWRVAVSGGTPQPVGLTIDAITHINTVALNPMGTAVAYTNGYVRYELWIMQNVLPR
jgi:Tol biopolymer transport system component